MGLRLRVILHGGSQPIDAAFNNTLINFVNDGTASMDEYARLGNTDMILKARSADGRLIWVAIEISSTINDDHIDRALRSAGILRRLFGEETAAAVAGYSIAEPQTEKARQDNVEVFIVKEPR